MEFIKRYLQAEDSEMRIDSSDKERPKIVGFAAVFNKLSHDLGGFREKIKAGAFSDTISDGHDVKALFNHDRNIVLGSSAAGTLALEERTKGLYYEITPPNTQAANDLVTSIDRGDIRDASFGFSVIDDKWEVKEEENIRTLLNVNLGDISPVTEGAYPDATSGVRSKDQLTINALKNLDIDPDIFQKIFVRMEHNISLSEDREYLEERFRKVLERIGGNKPDDQLITPVVSTLRQRLELKNKKAVFVTLP